MLGRIKNEFSKKFAPWKITLNDEELFVGNQKTIPTSGWYLKWVINEEEEGPYIEYYAIHDRQGHVHERIYESGREEQLEVLRQYIAYSPNIPGDRERSTKDFENYNKKLIFELQKRGLM